MPAVDFFAPTGGRPRRREPGPYRLPTSDDATDRSERKRLWAWLDSERQGWLALKPLATKLVQRMSERGVQALAGQTPEAYRARMMLGRALAGGKTAIQMWRNSQKALLQAPDAGIGRLGLQAVEGGPEFARMLLCVNQYIALQSMFRALDDGDRMVTREEFLSGSRGRVFWEQLNNFMADASQPLGSREDVFKDINQVHAGTRAEDDAITFDELASWAMMRMIPPFSDKDDLGPLPDSILQMSAAKREEMQRAGGTAWLGPVGHTSEIGLRPPVAKQYDHTSYISAEPTNHLGDGDDARARAMIAGVGHNTAKYVTPAHGFGKYTERHPIFATEASQSMSTFDGTGLSRAFEGEWATFRIVTRDARMRATTLGEPEIQVKGPAEVAYKIIAYGEQTARKMGHRHGRGGTGVYVCQWKASVVGDYVIKARLTSQVDLPLFVKKVTVRSAPTDGSLAALRAASVSDLRVVLSECAQRQAERELGRVRQWQLRSSPDWLRAQLRVLDAAQPAAPPGSPLRSSNRLSSPGRPGPLSAEAEAFVRQAERSVVVWGLKLKDSQSSVPDPRHIAELLALPKATHVQIAVPDPQRKSTLELSFEVDDDETAEALAAFLREHNAQSASSVMGVKIASVDSPSVHKKLALDAKRGGADSLSGATHETTLRVSRLLVMREKLEEEAMERSEVGRTHDLNFTSLLTSGSKVVMASVSEALRSASSESEYNQLEAAVLRWQETGTVASAEELYDDQTKKVEVRRPSGHILMLYKGKLYFCAEPLHYVLADFMDQDRGTPRLKVAGELGFQEWSFERDAWQVVAREVDAHAESRPRWSQRPKSAPPPWQPAYPKTPAGQAGHRNGKSADVPLDAFKQRVSTALPLSGAAGPRNLSNIG